MTTRREVLIGAAGLAAGAPLATTAQVGSVGGVGYDYLFVEVPQRRGGAGGPAPFVAHLTALLPTIAAAGGEALGWFSPLIGWSSEQLAVTIRWPERAPERERVIAALTRHPSVARIDRARLAATLRPGPRDRPSTTGITTHRWFEIRTPDVGEFVELSGAAWPEFERDFDAAIFGLFRAEQSADETRRGVTRMLLNTRYASHAVWEASRNPSPAAARAFARRSDLTLTTRVASVHFTPL
jgi:hypothetical protein